jgi:hypothetical protein
LHLEKVTRRRIPPGKVTAPDLDTVGSMLLTAQRVGTLRA